MLKWAVRTVPVDEMTCAYAAEGGHLEMLQWAFVNGCPWDWTTCVVAAERGHLGCCGGRVRTDASGTLTRARERRGGHQEVL